MTKAYLGLGSNLYDKQANCDRALEILSKTGGIKVLEKSTFYLTDPVGGPSQEKYLNGVVRIETDIEPFRLLAAVKDIEKSMGREAVSAPNMPRVIDIDILMYGDRVVRVHGLTVPHPKMHKRAFVLKGLAEIAPDEVHPVLKKTVKELLGKVQ